MWDSYVNKISAWLVLCARWYKPKQWCITWVILWLFIAHLDVHNNLKNITFAVSLKSCQRGKLQNVDGRFCFVSTVPASDGFSCSHWDDGGNLQIFISIIAIQFSSVFYSKQNVLLLCKTIYIPVTINGKELLSPLGFVSLSISINYQTTCMYSTLSSHPKSPNF